MIKRFLKKVIDVAARLFWRSQYLMDLKPVDYAGASLLAFVKLAREKGYRLVGTNAIATNAFFIREDILHTWLPEIEPSMCFNHPPAQFGIKYRLPSVKDKQWIEV